MAEELNEDPQWQVRVRVPMRLPGDMRDELFSVVVAAVEGWEPAPAERDGWDADVDGCPEGDRLSYRDSQLLLWLHAEAVRFGEQATTDLEDAREGWQSVVDALQQTHARQVGYTAQLEEEAYRLRREVEFEANGATTFSGADRLYEAREESEEGSGRDDTGQAGREEAAEQTVGTGYPQGSGPGHGSATPAPLSSRPQCAVHPEGQDGTRDV